MQRGSDKHGARKDDALARDVENMMRGTGPTHAEEWKDPDPPPPTTIHSSIPAWPPKTTANRADHLRPA
jgi:hypothetical protein